MNLYQLQRRIYKFLRSDNIHRPGSPFSNLTESFSKLEFALRFFYFCCFINAIYFVVPEWYSLARRELFEPQWVLWAFPWPESKDLVVSLVITIYTSASLFCVFFPFKRWARLLVFLGILYFNALVNSDGHYGHYMYMMMYPTFMFVFFPSVIRRSLTRARQMRALTIFFAAQLSICIAYQMAGYSKLTEIMRCLYDNGAGNCEFGGRIMTHMAAMEHIQYRWPTFSGTLLYDFSWVGGFLYYGIIWIHMISIVFAFRPHLHRFFLTYRVAFHFGTLILFGIGFSPNILAVCSVFALSPFYFKVSFWKQIKDLPPLNRVFS